MKKIPEKIQAKIDNVIRNGLARYKYPNEMKGEIARDIWDDGKFALGMEYGYILALLKENGIV